MVGITVNYFPKMTNLLKEILRTCCGLSTYVKEKIIPE